MKRFITTLLLSIAIILSSNSCQSTKFSDSGATQTLEDKQKSVQQKLTHTTTEIPKRTAQIRKQTANLKSQNIPDPAIKGNVTKSATTIQDKVTNIQQLNQENAQALTENGLSIQAYKKMKKQRDDLIAQNKDLKEQLSSGSRTILMWMIGVSIAGIIAGIILLKFDLQVGAVVSGAFIVGLSVCLAIEKWMVQLQWAGLIIIALVGLALGIYLFFKFFVHKTANVQNTQLIQHMKTGMEQGAKNSYFKAQNSIAGLMQSDSTKKIVSKIKAGLDKAKLKAKRLAIK